MSVGRPYRGMYSLVKYSAMVCAENVGARRLTSIAQVRRQMTTITMWFLLPHLMGPRKSIAIDCHAFSGIGNMCGCPRGLTVERLMRWQVSQFRQNMATSSLRFGQ
jgi:hypothetical protein